MIIKQKNKKRGFTFHRKKIYPQVLKIGIRKYLFIKRIFYKLGKFRYIFRDFFPIKLLKYSDPIPILGLKLEMFFLFNFSPFLMSLIAKIDLLNFKELFSTFLSPIFFFF